MPTVKGQSLSPPPRLVPHLLSALCAYACLNLHLPVLSHNLFPPPNALFAAGGTEQVLP